MCLPRTQASSGTTCRTRAIEQGHPAEAERAIRSIALGRKNWLFCASQRGGDAAAIHFSFVASCRRHNVDPFAYLRDVLTRLPRLGETPASDELRALLPDRWQSAQ